MKGIEEGGLGGEVKVDESLKLQVRGRGGRGVEVGFLSPISTTTSSSPSGRDEGAGERVEALVATVRGKWKWEARERREIGKRIYRVHISMEKVCAPRLVLVSGSLRYGRRGGG